MLRLHLEHLTTDDTGNTDNPEELQPLHEMTGRVGRDYFARRRSSGRWASRILPPKLNLHTPEN